MLDTTGRLQFANEAVRDLLDRDHEQLHGEALYRFFHPDDVDTYREECSELFRNGGRIDLQLRIQRPSGQVLWARVSLSYANPVDASPFVFGLIEDITEQKRGEDRLRSEKESALRATRTKSAFLANMSHEIRTPIHTITGMAELLMETNLDPEQREYGQQIRFAAEVLLGLVNDILDFSKIEAGKLSLETIDFDIVQTVEEAVDMVSLEAHKKSLDVVIDIDPAVPRHIKGDPVRIRQVVVNLFNNAVKFTEKGSITIQVQNAPGPAHKALLFRVNDTGVGVEREKLNRLFKPFSQVDPSTTRKYGGTGLGLSICRSLVEHMEGRIGVQSSPGRGSSFWFTFPVRYADDYHGESWLPSVDGDRDGRVLLIDDNDSARRTLGRYLGIWGFNVDRVESGEEGLARLVEAAERGTPYTLAVVDMLLPGIDGWQFASEVNADKRINETRLLLMSPTGIMGGEAKMKLLNWFNAYANKPVKWQEFATALSQALREEVDLEAASDLEPVDDVSLDADDTEPVVDAEPVPEAEPVEELSEVDVATQERAASPVQAKAAPTAGDRQSPESHRAARILVAEDHLVNQQLFRTILEKLGHHVEVADNGRIALEKVNDLNPHLIFLDVQMPEIGGYEAARLLRDRGYDRPIVAVTANAYSGEREKCLDYGMNDYMPKPFKPKDVRKLLETWITDELLASGDSRSWLSANYSGDATQRSSADELNDAFEGARPDVESFENGDDSEQGENSEHGESGHSKRMGTDAADPVEARWELPIFDFDEAVETFMGKRDVVERVMNNFISRLDRHRTELRQAVSELDTERIYTIAHSVKGGALSLHAMRVGRCASALEKSAFDGDLDRVETLVAELERHADDLAAHCSAFISPS